MSRATIAFIVAPGALLLLAACSSASPAGTTTSTTHGATTGTKQPAAATTTIDPCQLVTAPEASALTGASYGPGTEQTFGATKSCVYGGSTKNVFMVDVFQGSSDQLRQEGAQASAAVSRGGQVTPIPVSGLGDEATAYQVNDGILSAASIFALKGTAAIYLVDEVTGGQAPTTAALTATARTALGRLP